MTSTTPSVTFFISAKISSRFFVLGIPPTNRRQLSTLAQTPRRRPFLQKNDIVGLSGPKITSQRKGKKIPLLVPKHKAKCKVSPFCGTCRLGCSSGLTQHKGLDPKADNLLNLTSKWSSIFETRYLRSRETKANFCFWLLRVSLLLFPKTVATKQLFWAAGTPLWFLHCRQHKPGFIVFTSDLQLPDHQRASQLRFGKENPLLWGDNISGFIDANCCADTQSKNVFTFTLLTTLWSNYPLQVWRSHKFL